MDRFEEMRVFAAVVDALGTPSHWCDVLILPFNTKYCSVSQGAGGPRRVLDRYVFRPDGSFEHAHEEGSAPPRTRRGRWTLDGDDVVVVELDA